MGAPTSPVLANLAIHSLDSKMEKYAEEKNASYTRYADDLVFSSREILDKKHLADIKVLIADCGLKLKQEKTKICGPDDPKIVTGIIITNEGLKLEDEYLHKLEDEIIYFFKAKEIVGYYDAIKIGKLELHAKKIEGHIQYVGSIYGKNHEVYLKIKASFEKAKNMASFQKVSWLDYNNYAFLNKKNDDPLY